MARRLAQAQQGFQHLNLGAVHADRFDRLEQRLAVVIAQFVVELALFRLQLAVERLLGFLGQVLGDLLLGAAQDEGPQALGENGAGFRVRVARAPPASLNTEACPSMPGLRNSNRLHNSPR